MFSRTRNPNYLGEIMLYYSFSVIANHFLSYFIMIFAFCTIFPVRIFQKEVSLKQKPGWNMYKKQTNILFPKIFGLDES